MDRRSFNTRLGALGALAVSPVLTNAQSPARVDFWDMVWGPPAYMDTARALVAQFNKENPGIQVVYRSIPFPNWYQTFSTAIAAGSGPDISTGPAYLAVQFYADGAVQPIDDVIAAMKADGDLADFDPAMIDRMRYDGHYVGLPWHATFRQWYYRKDILKDLKLAVPQTWEQFRAVAKAGTGKGRYGVIAAADSRGQQTVLSAMVNNGGGLFTPTGAPNLKDPKNIEALNWLASLVTDKSVDPASAGYGTGDVRRAFLQGKALFMMDGPFLHDEAGAPASEQIGIVPPLKSTSGQQGTFSAYNNIMIYKAAKAPAAAKAFLRWWSKNQKDLWTKGGTVSVPARKSIAVDPFFQQDPNRRYSIDKYLPLGRPAMEHAPGPFPQLNVVEGEGFLVAMTQQLWQGKSVADIVDTADKRLRQIMSKK